MSLEVGTNLIHMRFSMWERLFHERQVLLLPTPVYLSQRCCKAGSRTVLANVGLAGSSINSSQQRVQQPPEQLVKQPTHNEGGLPMPSNRTLYRVPLSCAIRSKILQMIFFFGPVLSSLSAVSTPMNVCKYCFQALTEICIRTGKNEFKTSDRMRREPLRACIVDVQLAGINLWVVSSSN